MIKIGVFASKRRMDFYHQTLGAYNSLQLAGYLDTDDKANYQQDGTLLYIHDFLSRIDAVVVDRYVAYMPTELLHLLIRSGKHILMDGFMLSDLPALHNLQQLNAEARVVFQVAGAASGKPVFKTARSHFGQVQLVKLDKFTPSLAVGNFQRWLHFTTCNEIDMALRLISSDLKSLKAKPVFMFGDHPDLINVHAEFHNGAVFQMNFGRIPADANCLMRVYSKDRFHKLNLEQNTLWECKLSDEMQLNLDIGESMPPAHRFTEIEKPVAWFDAWKSDIGAFVDNITHDRKPDTGLDELFNVASLIQQVKHQLSRNYVFE